MNNRRVVIWGDDHHNALGLLRMLGNRGYNVLFLVDKVKNIATSSKYCTKYIEVSGVETGLKYLLTHFKNFEDKAVLLFTADRYSEAANNNRTELNKYFFVSGPTQEGFLSKIDDKYNMALLAQKCGINIPETILLPNDSINNVVLKFPLVIKPCIPVNKDFKIKVIQNRKILNNTIKNLIPNKRYVLQNYISKEADALVYGCRTMDGTTFIAGVCVRNRWSDDGCGSFGYITPDLPQGISRQSIAMFLENIDFYGLFSVEYALTNDNAYFYEFNLRNDGTSLLFYQAGANVALAYVNSCFGINLNESVVVKSKQYLINEIWDKFNVFDGIISKQQYETDLKKATLFFYYDKEDMSPYEIQKSQNIRRCFIRILKKSYMNKIRKKIMKIIK